MERNSPQNNTTTMEGVTENEKDLRQQTKGPTKARTEQ